MKINELIKELKIIQKVSPNLEVGFLDCEYGGVLSVDAVYTHKTFNYVELENITGKKL